MTVATNADLLAAMARRKAERTKRAKPKSTDVCAACHKPRETHFKMNTDLQERLWCLVPGVSTFTTERTKARLVCSHCRRSPARNAKLGAVCTRCLDGTLIERTEA